MKRLFLLLLAITVLCSSAYANWWDDVPGVREYFFESADAGHLNAWSGTIGGFADSNNYFLRNAAGFAGIYKADQEIGIVPFTFHAKMKNDLEVYIFAEEATAAVPDNAYRITFEASANRVELFARVGGVEQTTLSIGETLNTDVFYDLNVIRNRDGNFTIYINETWQGNSWVDLNFTANSHMTIRTNIQTGSIDEIAIYGLEEADYVNIVDVDGKSVEEPLPPFAFSIDGNLTLGFEVFDTKNERMKVDINYSDSASYGTGTVIVKDLNLNADVCDDLDWDDTQSSCSWDWDISGISDGNHYFHVSVTDDTNVSMDSSPAVTVASRVRLTVEVPRNEETGTLLSDSNAYAFVIRVNEDGNLTTYTDAVFGGFLDNQIVLLSLGTDSFISVEIDTNNVAVWNSRKYSYQFDSAQVNELLSPYLPPVDGSILTTVHTLSNRNLLPIEGIRVRAFKAFDTGRTLVHDSITDGKGETVIPFVIADEYEMEFYQDSSLLATKDYTATSTTNHVYFYISETGIVTTAEVSGINVTWSPSIRSQRSRDTNITATITSSTSSISSIQFYVANNDVNLFDSGVDTSAPSDTNSYLFIGNRYDLDTNYSIDLTVIVTLDNGDELYFSTSYTIVENVTMWLLVYGMRQDFGCSTNTDETCTPLMFVAFFIILFAVGGLAVNQVTNGIGLTILAVVILSFFTYILWIPLWIGVLMVMAGVGGIIARTRMD